MSADVTGTEGSHTISITYCVMLSGSSVWFGVQSPGDKPQLDVDEVQLLQTSYQSL